MSQFLSILIATDEHHYYQFILIIFLLITALTECCGCFERNYLINNNATPYFIGKLKLKRKMFIVNINWLKIA